LFDQLCRAALSVQLNISEGYAFTPSASFHRHLKIAYASAVETADALRALMATNSAPAEDVQPILDLCQQSQALILGLTRYVETSMRKK
jgi:four helix bundle protein